MFQIAKQHKKAWERCVHVMLADIVPYLCQLVNLVLLFPNKAGEWILSEIRSDHFKEL